MKATKSINFIYFRPVLAINDKRVKLTPYFEKIINDSENNKFGLEKVLSNIRLHSIFQHKEYKLSSGALIKAPIWELRFIKTRIDVPNKINIKSFKESKVDLSSDEQIYENTVLLYDPTTDVVIINQNRESVSHSKIATFINHFVTDDKLCVRFDVMADESLVSRAKKQEVYTALNMRLVNFNNKLLDEQLEGITSPSVANAIKTAHSFNIPQEFAANLELTITLQPYQKDASMEKDSFRKTISSLLDLHFNGLVDKIRLKSKRSATSKSEEMDLIAKLIKDTYNFTITETNRNISSTAISNAIAMKYNTRRSSFLTQ